MDLTSTLHRAAVFATEAPASPLGIGQAVYLPEIDPFTHAKPIGIRP